MRAFLICLFLILYTSCFAQDGLFYAYTADWSNTTDLKEAAYFKHVIKEDSSYVCRYYNLNGPLIRMESYSDKGLTRPVGRFAWYNEKGKIDSTGHVFDGKKDGYWMYFTHPDSSNATVTEYYNLGKFEWRTDYLNKRTIYRDGSVIPFETKQSDTTRPFVFAQKEASFPRGVAGWKKYLERNLKTPGRFTQIIKGNGRATVGVIFTVDKDGSISDVFLFKSAEWSVDTEAQRVIKNGPKWEPATQDGRVVKYRQRQSITFVVRED